VSAGAVADTPRPLRVTGRPIAGAVQRTTLIVAGLTVLAAVLRFVRIGHQSFWYDESFTALLVHQHSLGTMLGLVPRTELTPPLYYIVAWVWARIFGYGEAGLRSLSALAGVATVPVLYGAATELISRRAGLMAAALAACNPLLIWYSQEARSYALLVLFASVSLLAFAYARSPRPTRRWLVIWGLAASLTLATHYYGVLAVVPEAICLLWIHRRDRRVLLTIGAVGAFGLALLPIAISQRPKASWIAGYPFDKRLSQIGPQFLLGTGAPARTVLKIAGAAAVLLAATMLALRADASERRGALLAGGLALSGFLISLALVPAGVDELITRNIILVLVPLIVLVAGGLGARRSGVLGLAGVATLCTVGLIAAVAVAVDDNFQRPDWRGLAHLIGPRQRDGVGRAILIEQYGGQMPLAIYIPGLRFIKNGGARVNELDVIATKGSAGNDWFCWWGSACNMYPSVLDTAIHVRGFHRVGPVLHAGHFSMLRLRSSGAVHLTPRRVSRGLTNGPIYQDALLLQPPA
jgi:mannosyltransferase